MIVDHLDEPVDPRGLKADDALAGRWNNTSARFPDVPEFPIFRSVRKMVALNRLRELSRKINFPLELVDLLVENFGQWSVLLALQTFFFRCLNFYVYLFENKRIHLKDFADKFDEPVVNDNRTNFFLFFFFIV